MMKALITGVTGFVGSHLAELLLEKDVEVFGTRRWRSPLNNVNHIKDKINFINCELRDSKSTYDAINEVKPDVIYHLAAQSFVPASFELPTDTIMVNVIGTVNLLEAIRKSKIDPIIHVCSSSEVYGDVKKEEVPIKETNPLRPSSPYGVSKAAEDLLGQQYHQSYGLKTLITRMFTHTGPRRGQVFVVSAFAKQIAEIEKNTKKPILYAGNLDSIRTFADVRDAVKAYWLLTKKCKPGEVYNIGGKRTMTIREMLDMLLSMTDKKIKVEIDKKLLRPSDVTLQIPCIEKFVNATGWEPEIPFEKTLKDTLDYWRQEV